MTRSPTPRTLLAPLTLALVCVAGPPRCVAGGPPERTDAHGDPLPHGALLRLGTIRLRHGDGVCALDFSRSGTRLATVSRDRTVRLWDTTPQAPGRLLHQFQEAHCEYSAVALSPDGKLLVAAGGDPVKGGNCTLRVWDAITGKELRRLDGHQQSAYRLAFTPDGQTLLSVSCEQVIRWEVATGRELSQWKHLRSTAALAVSPDRSTLASAGGETEDKVVRLWEAATGKEGKCLKGHTRGVMAIGFSPDGARVATANTFEPIRLWDTATGKTVRTFGHQRGGMALAFSPDGDLLASADMSGTVRLWDTATGKLRRTLRDYRGWVNGLSFTPDGKTLALVGADTQLVHLWEVATGRDLRPRGGHQGHIHAVAYLLGGRMLASAGGDRQDGDTDIRLWDARTGHPLRLLEGHPGKVLCLGASPDGRLLASGGEKEDEVRVWDVANGSEVRRLRPIGKKNDTCSSERRVTAVAYSADGRLVAAGVNEGTLVVWDAESGQQQDQLAGHEGRITSLAFSPNGKYLVSGGLDRTVRLWDRASWKEVRKLGKHDDTLRTVAFSPDGRLIAAGGGDWQGLVTLWDAVSGKEVGRLGGEGVRLHHFAFAPDGRTLAMACAGRGLRVWEVATRQLRRCLPGHAGGVHAVAFAPDGLSLASGSPDSTVLVWDLAGGEAPRPAAMDALWADLGSEDAARADRAMRSLLAAPSAALPFLQARLAPVTPLPPERLAEILHDLDHKRYRVREQATDQLARLGELAAPLLRRRLEEPASLEMRRRVEILLQRLDTATLTPADLRALRAFEVLERIGGHEVRPLLEPHALQAPDCRLGQEARASLERLSRRP